MSPTSFRKFVENYTDVCRECKSECSWDQLARCKKTKCGVINWCKACNTGYALAKRNVDWFKYKISSTRSEARKKNVPFTLTQTFLEGLWERQNGKCVLTGIEMTQEIGKGARNKASLDQIIPGLGYTEDNVQLLTDWANRAKLDMTIQEFKMYVTKASQHLNN